jgi:hypothetical protein
MTKRIAPAAQQPGGIGAERTSAARARLRPFNLIDSLKIELIHGLDGFYRGHSGKMKREYGVE